MASVKPDEQDEFERCDCGGLMRFCPTASPWEFEGQCQGCKAALTRSWAHASPAPVFVPDPEPQQGGLF